MSGIFHEGGTRAVRLDREGNVEPGINLAADTEIGGSSITALGINNVRIQNNVTNTAVASGTDAVAFGKDTDATADTCIALGDGAQALTPGALACGSSAVCNGGSVALGFQANCTGSESHALGRLSQATGQQSIAIGTTAVASATDSIAIGSDGTINNTAASGTAAIAVGQNTKASAAGTVAVGSAANAAFANSMAFGEGATPKFANAVTFGYGTDLCMAEFHPRATIAYADAIVAGNNGTPNRNTCFNVTGDGVAIAGGAVRSFSVYCERVKLDSIFMLTAFGRDNTNGDPLVIGYDGVTSGAVAADRRVNVIVKNTGAAASITGWGISVIIFNPRQD